MEKDQRFSVVATLSSTDASGKKSYQIPMHRSFSEEFAQQYNLKIYASGIINPGESYALDEGKWVDWTEELVKIRNQDPANTDSFVYDNFALKAFADAGIRTMNFVCPFAIVMPPRLPAAWRRSD